MWVWRSGNVWSFVDSEEHGPAEQLSELQALAKAWRGECLSSVGELSNPRLRWRCSRGHEFEASAESVKMQRVWCPRWKCQRGNHPMCAQPLDRKPPPGVLLEMCRASGCRPLNTENHLIQDVDSKLQWVCAHGCRFEQSLLDGEKVPGWCPRCDADRREKLRSAQEIASRRGGQTVEAPADTLRWHRDMGAAVQVCCAQKHTFPLGLKKIIDGDWCPDCPPPDPPPPPPQQQQQQQQQQPPPQQQAPRQPPRPRQPPPQQAPPQGERATFTWPAGVVPGQVYNITHNGRNFEVVAPHNAQADATFTVTVPFAPAAATAGGAARPGRMPADMLPLGAHIAAAMNNGRRHAPQGAAGPSGSGLLPPQVPAYGPRAAGGAPPAPGARKRQKVGAAMGASGWGHGMSAEEQQHADQQRLFAEAREQMQRKAQQQAAHQRQRAAQGQPQVFTAYPAPRSQVPVGNGCARLVVGVQSGRRPRRAAANAAAAAAYAQQQVAAAAAAAAARPPPPPPTADGPGGIGAIVSRILKYANRPWDCLGLPAYTPAEHTRRHYRQLSLLIHPDKCDHPRAQEAMAILNNAFKKVTR